MRSASTVPASDHPRAGGEHVYVTADAKRTDDGSSPRRRGTPDKSAAGGDDCESGSSPRRRGTRSEYSRHELVHARIIPAQAGNTRRATREEGLDPDGSSPRRRGTPGISPVGLERGVRIIPAQAGNTLIITY